MADKTKFQRLMDAAQRAEGLGNLAEARTLRKRAARLRTSPEPEGNALAAGLRDAPAVKTMTHGRDSDASSEQSQEDSEPDDDEDMQTSTSSSEAFPEDTETDDELVVDLGDGETLTLPEPRIADDADPSQSGTDDESDGVPAPGSEEAEAALALLSQGSDLPKDEDAEGALDLITDDYDAVDPKNPPPSEGSGEGGLNLS